MYPKEEFQKFVDVVQKGLYPYFGVRIEVYTYYDIDQDLYRFVTRSYGGDTYIECVTYVPRDIFLDVSFDLELYLANQLVEYYKLQPALPVPRNITLGEN